MATPNEPTKKPQGPDEGTTPPPKETKKHPPVIHPPLGRIRKYSMRRLKALARPRLRVGYSATRKYVPPKRRVYKPRVDLTKVSCSPRTAALAQPRADRKTTYYKDRPAEPNVYGVKPAALKGVASPRVIQLAKHKGIAATPLVAPMKPKPREKVVINIKEEKKDG